MNDPYDFTIFDTNLHYKSVFFSFWEMNSSVIERKNLEQFQNELIYNEEARNESNENFESSSSPGSSVGRALGF